MSEEGGRRRAADTESQSRRFHGCEAPGRSFLFFLFFPPAALLHLSTSTTPSPPPPSPPSPHFFFFQPCLRAAVPPGDYDRIVVMKS